MCQWRCTKADRQRMLQRDQACRYVALQGTTYKDQCTD
ncbi:unnamed protein product [Linum tenue]|uniref:Uncharacterized protein n=1 Tax=Linum tenue TaxID=586396 RepID=A0AAV0P8B7_9ROSI|nr:unnamed protein product [Linum tenue]